MKLIGGGSLFLGLGALGIPNLLKTFEASAGKTGSQVVSGVNSSSNTTITSPPAGSQGSNIRPFQVNVPEAELVELRRRINATRWPERELVNDISQGVQLATMQKLARYWATDYDWRKVEAKLKALPQFITEIDGLDIQLPFFDVKNVTLPVAVSVFPDEIYQAPRSWAERAFPKLIYYNKVQKGGHFAAWEQPQLFSQEVRAGLRPLRK
jgi:pimeloyl-ACP methyl ester carboxylesterase